MNNDRFKIAIDDVRTRHKAVVDLIYFTDNQAMNLLRLYISIGLASSSIAIASFSNDSNIPPEVGVSLIAAVIVFIYGSYECFEAMSSASINLPGRDPDFWLWVETHRIKDDDLARTYLNQLISGSYTNDSKNKKSASHLKLAKLAGIFAIPAASATGIVYWATLKTIQLLAGAC